MAQSTSRGARARTNAAAAHSLHPKVLILATQAADQASLLAVMLNAYIALEKLITHDRDEGTHDLAATRPALGSLLHALNAEMKRQVDGLVNTTAGLHAFVADEAGLR